MSKRIQFTRAELAELWRAVDLITQEDESCSVNVDDESRAAKSSAKAKLSQALGHKSKAIDQGDYVDVAVLAGYKKA